MRKRIAKSFIVTATLVSMATVASMAGAATAGRIIPTGTITFHKNDQVIAKFTDQAPINDQALITCDMACSVKLTTMSLNVADGTTFALRDDGDVMNLYVKEGLVAFTVNNVTQQVSFFTPDGRYVKSEGFIAPTSTENSIKGFMDVSPTKAQIGIKQGGMILATADGIQTVDSGYTYSVDLNKLPATSVGGDMGGMFSNMTPIQLTGTIIGGVAGAGIVGAAIANDSDGTPQQGSQN